MLCKFMKRIKGYNKIKHKLVIKAVEDYFNDKANINIVHFIEGDKVNLTDEEKSDAWAIQQNLLDKEYVADLTGKNKG